MKPDRTYEYVDTPPQTLGGIDYGRGTVLMTFAKNWREVPRKSKGWRKHERKRKARHADRG